MEKERYSVHTFMFPFQWDYLPSNPQHNIPYNGRTHLNDFDRLFSANSCLRRTKFQIGSSAEKYSEYNYFYPFVRKALYHTRDDDFMRYYELEEEGGEYNICIKNTQQTLSLTLNSICMHVFDTGVGVLVFNLSNYNHPNPEDILHINDYGRRIYPQYLSPQYGVDGPKGSFLADKIYGHLGDLTFADDFSQYEESIENNACFLPPQHIRNIFGYTCKERIGDEGKDFVFRSDDERKKTIRIRQITDDRMFFLCYYNNGTLADEMAKKKSRDHGPRAELEYTFELDDFWYAFVYGDGRTPSVAEDRFQQEQILKCTYSRWLDNYAKHQKNNGTLFAMTKDSFVCLGSWPLLETHMLTMYYQMAILCLVQRASVLRFSYEISQITRSIFGKRINLSKQIREIYENYITFLNRIYFREVTAQIQGIEMYSKFQEAMNLEKEVKDLDNEIQELFEYQNLQEQERLNKIATLFLPITLITGVLGMNTFDACGSPSGFFTFINIIVIAGTVGTFIAFFKDFFKRKK